MNGLVRSIPAILSRFRIILCSAPALPKGAKAGELPDLMIGRFKACLASAAFLVLALAGSVQAQQDPALVPVAALIENEEYASAETALQAVLAANPANAKAHGLLALVQLRQDDVQSVKARITILRELQAGSYADRIERALQEVTRRKDLATKLAERLREFDPKGTERLIENSNLSDSEAAMLRVWLRIYSADWKGARELLQTAVIEDEVGDQLERSIAELQERWLEHQCVASWAVQLPSCHLTPEVLQAMGDVVNRPDALVGLYVGAAAGMLEIAPLSGTTQSILVVAGLLTSPLEDVELTSRQIMESMGSISIAVTSVGSDRSFSKDADGRRVYTVTFRQMLVTVDADSDAVCVQSQDFNSRLTDDDMSGFRSNWLRKKKVRTAIFKSVERPPACEKRSEIRDVKVGRWGRVAMNSLEEFYLSRPFVDANSSLLLASRLANLLAALCGSARPVKVPRDSGMFTMAMGLIGATGAALSGDTAAAASSQQTLREALQIREEAREQERRQQTWDATAAERAFALLELPAFSELQEILLSQSE